MMPSSRQQPFHLHTQKLKTKCPVCESHSSTKHSCSPPKSRIKPPAGVARMILEDLIEELENENTRLRQKCLDLQTESASQATQSDMLATNLKHQNADLIKQLKKTQDALTTATDEIIRIREGANEKVRKLRDQLAEFSKENTDLNDAIDRVRQQNGQLAKVCTSSQRDGEAILQENNQLRMRLSDLERETEGLRSRNKDFVVEVDDLKLTIRRLEMELKRAIEKSDSIAHDAKVSKASEKLPLVIENAALREENEKLQTYIQQLTERFRQTTKEVRRTGTDIRHERATSPPRKIDEQSRIGSNRSRMLSRDMDTIRANMSTLSLAKAFRKAAWENDEDEDDDKENMNANRGNVRRDRSVHGKADDYSGDEDEKDSATFRTFLKTRWSREESQERRDHRY